MDVALTRALVRLADAVAKLVEAFTEKVKEEK